MKVVWSKNAHNERIRIFDYIAQEFGLMVALSYDEKITKFERLVAEMPSIGAAEPLLAHRSKPYQSFVVHKLTKVVYFQEKDTVFISALWDTRREPGKLKKSI